MESDYEKDKDDKGGVLRERIWVAAVSRDGRILAKESKWIFGVLV